MAIEFLGHKHSLLGFIVPHLEEAADQPGGRRVAADLFCGTGSVSVALREAGWSVHANDQLALCAAMAASSLLTDGEPEFLGIQAALEDAPAAGLLPPRSAYEKALAVLHHLPPTQGFFWQHYSPASSRFEDVERRYFTERNAARIDAIRDRIKAWEPALTAGEHALLMRSLVEGTNAVSNIAGTYGCYLKRWKKRALRDLTLAAAPIGTGGSAHRVSCSEALAIAGQVEAPISYLDPPYTKRQYAAYYHVLETLVRDDKPPLEGSTGLRPWHADASDWCYRRKAPAALEALLAQLRSEHVFLSYNEDGQIPHGRVIAILEAHGDVEVHEISYRRYKSSDLSHKGNTLVERLYHLRRH